MLHFIVIVAAAAIAFVTTNIDDILLLMVFFTQVNLSFRKRHIVTGHYLGFSAIVAISLLGCAGALILPHSVVGLLGLVPIGLGVYQLLHKQDDDDDKNIDITQIQPRRGFISSLVSVHTLSVAGVTLANGADNVSVYVPLFASQRPQDVILIIAVFLVMVGVWCYAGYRLVRYPAIAQFLESYGERLVPYVFILLGLYIVLEGTLSP